MSILRQSAVLFSTMILQTKEVTDFDKIIHVSTKCSLCQFLPNIDEESNFQSFALASSGSNFHQQIHVSCSNDESH
jgi:hypothetical protein